MAHSDLKTAAENVDMDNSIDHSNTSNIGTDSDYPTHKRNRQSMYMLNKRGFNGIGPKIDTNLEEARRLAAIDLKTKKNKELIEMVDK